MEMVKEEVMGEMMEKIRIESRSPKVLSQE